MLCSRCLDTACVGMMRVRLTQVASLNDFVLRMYDLRDTTRHFQLQPTHSSTTKHGVTGTYAVGGGG